MNRAVWTGRAQADLIRIDDVNARNDPGFDNVLVYLVIAEGVEILHACHGREDGRRCDP